MADPLSVLGEKVSLCSRAVQWQCLTHALFAYIMLWPGFWDLPMLSWIDHTRHGASTSNRMHPLTSLLLP